VLKIRVGHILVDAREERVPPEGNGELYRVWADDPEAPGYVFARRDPGAEDDATLGGKVRKALDHWRREAPAWVGVGNWLYHVVTVALIEEQGKQPAVSQQIDSFITANGGSARDAVNVLLARVKALEAEVEGRKAEPTGCGKDAAHWRKVWSAFKRVTADIGVEFPPEKFRRVLESNKSGIPFIFWDLLEAFSEELEE